jgi:electron transfer flavoprotein alpha/beta subunit
MHYWEEMRSKWGFGDGDAVPQGADLYREVYINAINALAERDGAQHRAYPFDRAGLHNWCLIAIAPKDVEVDADGTPVTDFAGDEALAAQIEEAMTMGLDEYVQVEVRLQADDFANLLARLAEETP